MSALVFYLRVCIHAYSDVYAHPYVHINIQLLGRSLRGYRASDHEGIELPAMRRSLDR